MSWLKKLLAFLLKILALAIFILPTRLRNILADGLGLFVFYVLRFRIDLVKKHLYMAFPDWDEGRIKKIARLSYCHQGRTLLEYVVLPFISKKWIAKNVDFIGLENYAKAMAEEKGAMLLTLHLGNGDLALATLAQSGLPINLISRHFNAQWLNELWFGLRGKTGIRFIPEEKSSFQILKALKKKDVVVFVIDQFMGPPAGIKTKFFGIETGTAAGLALFALRSGAPVLPAYTYRQKNGKYAMVFQPPLYLTSTEDTDADLHFWTQKFNDVLEKIIKNHPEQWIWLHRRWKTWEVRLS